MAASFTAVALLFAIASSFIHSFYEAKLHQQSQRLLLLLLLLPFAALFLTCLPCNFQLVPVNSVNPDEIYVSYLASLLSYPASQTSLQSASGDKGNEEEETG